MRNSVFTYTASAGAILLSVFAAVPAQAGTVAGGGGCPHVIDGAFTSPQEWANCATAQKTDFPQVASGGGASLYVDQGQGQNNNLYLMYDYWAGGSSPASFFDVFFEVVPDNHDYLVRIAGGGIEAFERPLFDPPAPILPDGSFDIGPGSDWSPLGGSDLQLANFQAALGFGVSPGHTDPHPMAEFSLTIDRSGNPGGGPGGIYSPDPAFWSASVTDGLSPVFVDPPISSGIFQLNPDGTTLVTPVLGPDGGPVQQGSAIPEPASLMMMVSGALALLGARRLRK